MNSAFLKLNTRDFTRGLVVAILGAVFAYVSTILEGNVAVDWGYLLKVAATAGAAYLSKNLMTSEDGKILGKL